MIQNTCILKIKIVDRLRMVVLIYELFTCSRSEVKSRGTGPSKWSQSNRSASRGHSASSTEATASLKYHKKILLVCIVKCES